jgi:hypothetical protein
MTVNLPAIIKRLVLTLLLFLLVAQRLPAALTGPTLHFDYGAGTHLENPLSHFMYFIPLISPGLVTVYTNVGNTQRARVLTLHCVTNGADLHAVCEFELTGTGVQRSVFDLSPAIRRHEQTLLAGHPLTHQLAAITVAGAGRGNIEIDGRLTNGLPTITELRLRFNPHGQVSPVSIRLEDLASHQGVIGPENEMVARVNVLAFRRQPGPPQMEVTLDSLKSGTAGDSAWQNWLGSLKGMAVNMFLPPLTVTAGGHQAMLAFGLALATAQPACTFPFATRLQAIRTELP